MAELRGIDVSEYQGTIDWARVKAAGIRFAFIRVGWVDNSILKEDIRFRANMAGAIAAGIPVGVYVYSYVTRLQSAAAAAERVLEAIRGYKVEYPVAFDVEDARAQYQGGLTREQNAAIVRAFCDRIAAGGQKPMLYTYTNFAQTKLDMAALSAYPLWIADYRGYVGYAGEYTIWQTSSTGRVDGISGAVDLDISTVDYAPRADAGYAIRVGLFLREADAVETLQKIRAAGYYCELVREKDGWSVLSFTYTDRTKAEALAWLFTNAKYSTVLPR